MKKYTKEFLIKAHDKSSYHKEEIKRNSFCGCFYCEKVYQSKEIKESTDDGETAICPKCGIDSVLSAELPIDDKAFLDQMNNYWF